MAHHRLIVLDNRNTFILLVNLPFGWQVGNAQFLLEDLALFVQIWASPLYLTV